MSKVYNCVNHNALMQCICYHRTVVLYRSLCFHFFSRMTASFSLVVGREEGRGNGKWIHSAASLLCGSVGNVVSRFTDQFVLFTPFLILLLSDIVYEIIPRFY